MLLYPCSHSLTLGDPFSTPIHKRLGHGRLPSLNTNSVISHIWCQDKVTWQWSSRFVVLVRGVPENKLIMCIGCQQQMLRLSVELGGVVVMFRSWCATVYESTPHQVGTLLSARSRKFMTPRDIIGLELSYVVGKDFFISLDLKMSQRSSFFYHYMIILDLKLATSIFNMIWR